MNYNKYLLTEKITRDQLNDLEKVMDALYATIGVDVEFTKHFFDRVNDARNKRDISIPELQAIFRKVYGRYAKSLTDHSDGMEAILKDLQTNINIPIVLKWDKKSKKIDMVSKTIMRKKNFLSHDVELKV